MSGAFGVRTGESSLRCQLPKRRLHQTLRTSLGVGGLASVLAAASCSSDSSPSDTGDDAMGTPMPEAGQGFVVGASDLPGESTPATGAIDSGGCLGETRQAEAIGLDMFVMLDISGSMLDPLPS